MGIVLLKFMKTVSDVDEYLPIDTNLSDEGKM